MAALLFASMAAKAQLVNITAQELERDLKPIYLSDLPEYGAYKLLENVQAQYCAKAALLPCTSNPGLICINLLDRLERKFGTAGLAKRQGMVRSALDSCKVQGTRYEPAGTFRLYRDTLNVVDASAKELGHGLDIRPIVGSLPLQQFNASSSSEIAPIILINQNFGGMLAGFSQVACLSVPTMHNDKGTEILAAQRTSELLIAQSPRLRDALVHDLHVYMGAPEDREYNSTPLCNNVQATYVETMMRFVIAHEYGHLYLQHPATMKDDPTIASSELKANQAPLHVASPFVRELEADEFAYRILSARPKGPIPEGDLLKGEFDEGNFLGAVEFYFLMRSIVTEAMSDEPLPTAASTFNGDLPKRLAQCIQSNDCNIASFETELSRHYDLTQYPPDTLRGAIAREYRMAVLAEHPDKLSQLVDLLNRNASLLWQGSKQEWQLQRREDEAIKRSLRTRPKAEVDELVSDVERRRLVRQGDELHRLRTQFPDADGILFQLAQNLHDIAELDEQRDKSATAQEEYGQALAMVEQAFSRHADDPMTLQLYVQCLGRLALLEMSHGDTAASARHAGAAVDILEARSAEFAQDYHNMEAETDLLVQLASAQIVLKEFMAAALSLSRLDRLLANMPVSDPYFDERRRIMSELRWNLGCRLQDGGDLDGARQDYATSLAILKSMVTPPQEDAGSRLLLAQRSTLLALANSGLVTWQQTLDYWNEADKHSQQPHNPNVLVFVKAQAQEEAGQRSAVVAPTPMTSPCVSGH